MGSYRVAALTVDRIPLHDPLEVPSLWSRGGLEGLEVHLTHRIKIPRPVILQLVAEEYRNQQISKLESMEYSDIIRLIME